MDSTSTITILNNTFRTFCQVKKNVTIAENKALVREKKGNKNYKFTNS